MPCYHPMIRVEDRSKWEIAADGHKYHPAKIFKPGYDPGELEKLEKYTAHRYKSTIIPCQNCIGCRLDYSREWANRGYLEAKMWDENYFVTLTYDEKHLVKPDFLTDYNGITWCDDGTWEGGTLVPKHVRTFMNTLRKIEEREYGHTGIRFMAAGEYGEEGKRPHYHLILFNCKLPLDTFFEPRIINGETYYRNKIIERAWTKGISNISACTWNTIAYVSRYITKKINGAESEELYYSNGKIKEFMRCSNHPGIGYPYYEKYKEKIYATDSITVKNSNGIITSKPPKYFDDLYEKENPNDFFWIQRKRQEQGESSTKLKAGETSLFLREYLEVLEREKETQSKQLRRSMESGRQ